MIRSVVFLYLLVGIALVTKAQESIQIEPIVCYKNDFDAHTAVYAENFGRLRQQKTSEILVTYVDMPAAAQTAFNNAVAIWESYLYSPIPIKVKATWTSLPGSSLASSGATRVFRNFKNAPYTDIWFVIPLAEALAGEELNTANDFEINININKNINWSYTGTPIAGKYDLSTIVMHELAHGLGFASTMKPLASNTEQAQHGQSGYDLIYDKFLEINTDLILTDTKKVGNPSSELLSYITGKNLRFNTSKSSNDFPQIYAPSKFTEGGSISHFDENQYAAGSLNALLTPNIAAAEVIQKPGPLVLNVLQQMGWLVYRQDAAGVLSAAPAVAYNFLVYPNPTSDVIKVYTPNTLASQQTTAELFDQQGILLKKEVYNTVANPNFYIDMLQLNTGKYFLRLSNEKGVETKQVIKY